MEYILVTTTCPDEDAARLVADALLSGGLAACVQFLNISSWYVWQGKIEQTPEILLLIKTTADHWPAVEKRIVLNHPYEVPQIVCLPISGGSAPYLSWIGEVTS